MPLNEEQRQKVREFIVDLGKGNEEDCYFCERNTKTGRIPVARYDFKTLNGQWAYGCYIHYLLYRAHTTLGVGKAQYLKYEGVE